ncbi:Egg cell-secreted protein 1.1 [Ananas comosus]|uniref:Egg cell-secreted protein 1.1 n=1 Tax=Ananas comosus TaxID=4615 RepID=A0A199VTY3_ANACO|nr:Egg cell-secreted protein 1.1 [Ananas comosus]
MKHCWDSLVELWSCAGEVILFFLNSETYLGPSCCRAIRVIEHHCWATDVLLASLGFTAQEGDILRGYCDPTNDSSDPSTPPPPPAPPSIPLGPASH